MKTLRFLLAFIACAAGLHGAGTPTFDTVNGVAIAGGANTITLGKGTTTITLNTTGTIGSAAFTAASAYAPAAGSTSILTLGTIGTGTWQGSIIAPAYLGTGTGITTKYLRGDGTWQTVDTGLTVATTAITGGTSGRVLYNNAGVLGEMTTSGSGTTLALTTSPTFVTPDLGTPSALVGTNITGTASGLTAGNVTTNANLTGHVTSVGNAAVLGSFTAAQLSAAVSDGDPAYVGAANTFTAANTFSAAGANSAAPLLLSGALNTGGTGTTTFPHIFHQPTGATAYTAWSNGANKGTVFGANESSGFTGNFAEFCVAGSQIWLMTASGEQYSDGYYGLSGVATSPFNGMGILAAGTSPVVLRHSNQDVCSFSGSTGPLITMPQTAMFRWSANTVINNAASPALTLSQSSAGVLQIGTTAANALGSLLLTNLTASGALITTPEAIAPALDAGITVSVATVATGFALNGVNALTLANGTNGQIKTIVCTAVTAAGTATLTPTTCSGFTTVAFTAAGQTLTLQYFTTGGWVILSVRGATPA